MVTSLNDTPALTMRTFVHSLNALLKGARLYGLQHHRSDEQFEETWNLLKDAVEASGPDGLVIGVSSGELVLNGEALESSAAQLSLAQILANTGIRNIIFTRGLLQDSFLDFVKVFARGISKPSQALQTLKHSFSAHTDRGIRINEIRFAPSHPANDAEPRTRLCDPRELLRMLGADPATLRMRRFSSFDFGEELLGDGTVPESLRPVTEKESHQLIELIARIGVATDTEGPDREEWKRLFKALPENPKAILCQAITNFMSFGLTWLDDLALDRLSHDVAILCATEQFVSGVLSAADVRPFLARLCEIVADFRSASSKKWMADQKRFIKAQTETLERQFWASAREDLKQKVLLSLEISCVPPKNIQQSVKELQQNNDSNTAEIILKQYARCVSTADAEARKRIAAGLNELSDVYTITGGAPLREAVRSIGAQLHKERDAEVQGLLGAAFAKLSRHAAERREFAAVQQVLASLGELERARPNWTQGLRPRIGFESRIPEFIEHALKSERLEDDFINVMRHVPQGAGEYLASRLMKVTHASEREKVVSLARAIGEPLQVRLREVLELASAPKAVRVAGLLSRLEPAVVAQLLPERIVPGGAQREIHDEVLRQLSIAAAPERGQMLMSTLERFDSLVVPMALDEIGMCGDVTVASELLCIANGQRLSQSSEFIRVKAIEALGRLRIPEMESHLLRFVEEKSGWRWTHRLEMRLAAGQALTKLNPERARVLLSNAGLDSKLMSLAPLDVRGDRDFIRYRRYQRIRMTRPLPAVVQSIRGKCHPEVQVLSLEGGLLNGTSHLTTGVPASLRLSFGLRPIHVYVLVRFKRPNQAGVEMVGMNLQDRARLRSLLVSMVPSPSHAPSTLSLA